MKRLILFTLLLTVAVLAITGCDMIAEIITLYPTTATEPATTTEVTTTAEGASTPTDSVVTTTAESETTTTTTAATTTTAPVTTATPWILDEDMSLYVEMDAALYKEVALKLPAVAEITMTDVERYIFSQRATSTLLQASGPVQYGDTVNLYYRGEVNMGTKDAPVWVEFLGGNNFTSDPHSLGIGSGSFIPGFEDALIGLDPADMSITSAADGKIFYITYTFSYIDANGATKTSAMVDRVDLTKDGTGYTAACRYGDAFRDAIAGLAVGEYLMDGEGRATLTLDFDITGDLVAEEITMTDIKVVERTNELTKSFTISFPTNYTEPLAGREARWQVVVTGIKRPVLLDLDYTLISQTIGITYAAILAKNERFGLLSDAEIAAIGDDAAKQEAAVMALFEQYILLVMQANRRTEIEESLWNAFADYITNAVTVKSYPEAIKASYATTLRTQALSIYQQYVYYYNFSGTFADFLPLYYGEEYFPDGESTDNGFVKMAELQLRYEMAVYYIVEAEGLGVPKDQYAALAAEEMQNLIEYYNSAYGQNYTEEDMRKAGITDEALIENAYFNRARTFVAETLYDLIVFE